MFMVFGPKTLSFGSYIPLYNTQISPESPPITPSKGPYYLGVEAETESRCAGVIRDGPFANPMASPKARDGAWGLGFSGSIGLIGFIEVIGYRGFRA